MYTVTLAYELRDTAFKVNAIDPGYTKPILIVIREQARLKMLLPVW